MTSPLLHLFAVFWWLLVAGSVGVAICGTWVVWEFYHSSLEYTAYRADLAALAILPKGTVGPAQRSQPVPQTSPAPDPNQQYFLTPEEAQEASTKPSPGPLPLSGKSLAALPMATIIFARCHHCAARPNLVCRRWRCRPAAFVAAVRRHDRDPLDHHRPLALRPALVVLAPARRGPEPN